MPVCLEVARSGNRENAVNANSRAFKGSGRRKAPIFLLDSFLLSYFCGCVAGKTKMDGIDESLWGALYRVGVSVIR